AAPLTDRASQRWLMRQNNPYYSEIEAMAQHLAIPGVFSLNLCFEWGCTGGIWPSAEGPMLWRVLDWAFPALGENMVVLRQPGTAGEFLHIGWPGLAGMFQGVAPGRFAAAINQAPMRRQGAGYIGDWALNRRAVGKKQALPPAHLLRSIFEQAPDYGAAKRLLCETPIALPAIFLLAGPGPGQGCVIERQEDRSVLREMGRDGVSAANHFHSPQDHGGGWRPRPIDSMGRAARACGFDSRDFAAEFGWFVPPIANVNSRLAFHAVPATGSLSLMGTY